MEREPRSTDFETRAGEHGRAGQIEASVGFGLDLPAFLRSVVEHLVESPAEPPRQFHRHARTRDRAMLRVDDRPDEIDSIRDDHHRFEGLRSRAEHAREHGRVLGADADEAAPSLACGHREDPRSVAHRVRGREFGVALVLADFIVDDPRDLDPGGGIRIGVEHAADEGRGDRECRLRFDCSGVIDLARVGWGLPATSGRSESCIGRVLPRRPVGELRSSLSLSPRPVLGGIERPRLPQHGPREGQDQRARGDLRLRFHSHRSHGQGVRRPSHEREREERDQPRLPPAATVGEPLPQLFEGAAEAGLDRLDGNAFLRRDLPGREPFEVAEENGGAVRLIETLDRIDHQPLRRQTLVELLRRRPGLLPGGAYFAERSFPLASPLAPYLSSHHRSQPPARGPVIPRRVAERGEHRLLHHVLGDARVSDQAAREGSRPREMIEPALRLGCGVFRGHDTPEKRAGKTTGSGISKKFTMVPASCRRTRLPAGPGLGHDDEVPPESGPLPRRRPRW